MKNLFKTLSVATAFKVGATTTKEVLTVVNSFAARTAIKSLMAITLCLLGFIATSFAGTATLSSSATSTGAYSNGSVAICGNGIRSFLVTYTCASHSSCWSERYRYTINLYGPGGLIQSIQTASSSTTAIQYFNNINIIPGTYQATVTLERRPCVGSWYNSETVVTNLITVTNSTAALPVLNADFNLTAVSLAGTPNYKVAATGVTNTGTNPYAHFGFSWNIVEVSLTNGATIPGTEVDNSSNWWGASQIPTTTFIGYNGTSTVSGNGNGIFKLGHKYRITRGVWEDCRGWSSVSKMVYICSTCRTNNTNPILVEESMADSELQTIQINSMMTDQNKLILPTVASEARFAVYPNPTTGEITVQHTVNTKWLQVHDLMGKSLLEQTPNGSTQTTFDLSSLTSGIYLLCADGEVPQKIVKQ